MPLTPALHETLVAVAALMTEARAPWWIIASAAAALHGATPIVVRDVDVLLDSDDAARLLPRIGLPVAPGRADTRFRSGVFATWRDPPLAVEFMAGLHVYSEAAWQPVSPRMRVPIDLGAVRLFVPDRAELAAMFRLFGRPKDRARAAMLDALVPGARS